MSSRFPCGLHGRASEKRERGHVYWCATDWELAFKELHPYEQPVRSDPLLYSPNAYQPPALQRL